MSVLLGVILLSSILTFSPSLAANANFNFPSDPSDGNLSQTPSTGSNNPDLDISGTNIFVVWQDGADILFSNSTNNGDSFSDPTSLGSSNEAKPKISVDGDYLFVIWTDNGNVEFNRSTDKGISFAGAEVQLSSASSADPQITSADSSSSNPNDVYGVWRNVDGSDDIFFIKSSDNGSTFESVLDIGDTNVAIADPQIANAGDNVYVIWQTSTDIMFALSTNNGDSFTISDIGDSTGSFSAESYPQIKATGSFVYAVWQEGSNIKFTRSTNSGVSFSVPVDIGNTGGSTRDSTPQLALSGNDVYVIWRDGAFNSGDIKFIKSQDNGANFGTEINLSNNSGESSTPSISVSSPNIFIAWEDDTPSAGTNKDIQFALSSDSGDSFGGTTTIIENDGISSLPIIKGEGNSTFIVWQDSTLGANEIFFKLGEISPISITFDKSQYKISDTAMITIIDGDSVGFGSINATITSDTDSVTGITIPLLEGPDGTFSGTFSFTEGGTSSGNVLKVSSGDKIIASYNGNNVNSLIFPASIVIGSDPSQYGTIVPVTVIDQSSNTDELNPDHVIVQVTSKYDTSGITLTLVETGPNTGEFSGNVALMIGNNLFQTNSKVNLCLYDESSNLNSTSIDDYNMPFKSSSDSTGINLNLLETGSNSSKFDGTLTLSTISSDSDAGKLLANAGDFIEFNDKSGDFPNVGLVIPNSDPSNGAIQVAEPTQQATCSSSDKDIGITPKPSTVSAGYKSLSNTQDVIESGSGGGGGGGLVRPSLVVNAIGGLGGGGSAYSSPTLQLSNLVLHGQIEFPPEVEQIVLNHDSTIPQPAFNLDYFETFDWPLIIDDKGFILSGYTTTIETQNLKTNTPHTFKFLFYETEKIQHFSIYMNLRDAYTSIPQSDTQILYNDGFGTDVVDPNGFFENVTLTVNEIDNIKKEVVLEITFAKEMDTTDMIVRAWDPLLNSFDTYILDAIKVVPEEEIESPTPTYSEPIISELKSTTIPLWIKSNAAWWSDQQISDDDFVAGLEYLIKNGIINVPGVEVSADSTATQIPEWIQNNAGWWADSLISDDDFIEAMQWLIANGVIQI